MTLARRLTRRLVEAHNSHGNQKFLCSVRKTVERKWPKKTLPVMFELNHMQSSDSKNLLKPYKHTHTFYTPPPPRTERERERKRER